MRRPLIHTIPHEWLCATCLSPSQQDSLRHAPDCAPPPPPIHAKPPHPIAPTVLGIWFLSSQLQSCFKRKLYDLIVQVIFARLLNGKTRKQGLGRAKPTAIALPLHYQNPSSLISAGDCHHPSAPGGHRQSVWSSRTPPGHPHAPRHPVWGRGRTCRCLYRCPHG